MMLAPLRSHCCSDRTHECLPLTKQLMKSFRWQHPPTPHPAHPPTLLPPCPKDYTRKQQVLMRFYGGFIARTMQWDNSYSRDKNRCHSCHGPTALGSLKGDLSPLCRPDQRLMDRCATVCFSQKWPKYSTGFEIWVKFVLQQHSSVDPLVSRLHFSLIKLTKNHLIHSSPTEIYFFH